MNYQEEYITYIIQPGDTLHQLAQKFDTTCQILQTLNHLTEYASLCSGDTLRIPENFSS